jgi:hypothetical protein
MATRIDGDHFSIECRGKVLIIELRNTDTTPVFNFRAMDQLIDAIKKMVTDNNMAAEGWHSLYDFSKLNNFDMAVWPGMAKFARWTNANGRKKLAHLFPSERNVEQMRLIKQVIAGLINAYGIKDGEHYTASSIDDALAWLNSEQPKPGAR